MNSKSPNQPRTDDLPGGRCLVRSKAGQVSIVTPDLSEDGPVVEWVYFPLVRQENGKLEPAFGWPGPDFKAPEIVKHLPRYRSASKRLVVAKAQRKFPLADGWDAVPVAEYEEAA